MKSEETSKVCETQRKQAHIDALRELTKEESGINWEHYEKIKRARAKLQPK